MHQSSFSPEVLAHLLQPAYRSVTTNGRAITPTCRAAGEIADVTLVLRDRAAEFGLTSLCEWLDLAVAEAMREGTASTEGVIQIYKHK